MKTTKTDSLRKRILKHGERLLAVFPDAMEQDPLMLYKKLRKLEGQAASIALRLCNGPDFPREDTADRLFDGVLSRANYLLGNKGQVPVFINRDPRGAQLKVNDSWIRKQGSSPLPTDWGGYGILAPDLREPF